MLSARDDGLHDRDHARGIVEHLAVVESEHEVSESDQQLIPPQVSSTMRRLRVMRLAVALDDEPIAHEEVGAIEVARRAAGPAASTECPPDEKGLAARSRSRTRSAHRRASPPREPIRARSATPGAARPA